MENQTTINWISGEVIETNAMLIDFNEYLNELGFNVKFTIFQDSNYLSIVVNSLDDVNAGKSIVLENIEEIIDTLYLLAKTHNQILKHDRNSWKSYSIKVYSFEIFQLGELLTAIKAEFIHKLNSALPIKPKHVFFHSHDETDYRYMPGFYIVFNTPQEAATIDQKMKTKIENIGRDLLSQKGLAVKYRMDIRICDMVTNSGSLYGMSRED